MRIPLSAAELSCDHISSCLALGENEGFHSSPGRILKAHVIASGTPSKSAIES